MLYYILKYLVKATLWVFFRKLTTVYHSSIPKKGPLIILANHPSTFLDPLIIASITNRKVYFLAKGSLFSNFLIRFIFKQFNMIPVYRAQDDATQMGKNNETFDKCYEHLEKGGVILLFPEGVSITEKKLKPIKTGAARIALGAEARNHFKLGVKITTIGLNYENPHQFRKNVVVHIGKPILVNDFKNDYEMHPHQASTLLTESIKSKLEELIIDINEKEHEQLSDDLFEIYRCTLDQEKKSLKEITIADYLLQKKIAVGVQYFAFHQQERYQKMRQHVLNYHVMLQQLNLSSTDFSSNQKTKSTFWQVVSLIGLLPLFLFGFVFNYLPFIVAPVIAKKISKQLEFQGPISMIAGMFLYLINYSVLACIFYTYINSSGLVLLFIVSVFLSGLVAYWYAQTFLVVHNKWRLMQLFFKKNNLIAKLIVEREAIIEEIERAESELKLSENR
jgi:glycerol-3-phosphate O-acyltransferase / dihydroxyacetone phosphate acyltransferase